VYRDGLTEYKRRQLPQPSKEEKIVCVGTIIFLWCWNHHIPMASTPCLVITFFLSLHPLSSPLSSPPSFAPFVAMTNRAARYESIALCALLPCNATFVYINSSIVLSIESIIYSRTYFVAADRFTPCTYCRANISHSIIAENKLVT